MIWMIFTSPADDIVRPPVDTTTFLPRVRDLAMWALREIWFAVLDSAAMYGASFCGIPRPEDLRADAAGRADDGGDDDCAAMPAQSADEQVSG